jgi:transcriptional regulator with XRE-family HTH domain
MTKRLVVTPQVQAWRDKHPLRKWLDKENAKSEQAIKDIAERLAVTRSTIYGWLYGTTEPRLATLGLIQKATGIRPDAWVAWLRLKPAAAEPPAGKGGTKRRKAAAATPH